MKWALIVIAALALIIVVVTLIGYALPKKHTVTRTVRLRRSAERPRRCRG